MRVVTTTCSNTEIVCALGCAHMLVGVDEHSDFPEEVVSRLPRVGPDLGIDPDKVAALEPDLVIASYTVPGHEQVVDGLIAKGLRVFAPEPVSLADVYRDVRDIAELLGVPERGEALAAEMEATIEGEAAPDPNGPRVLVEWWPKPVIVPGRDSWVTQLLEKAGGVNPLAHEAVKSRPITDDEAVAMSPEAVVISWCGVPFHRYREDVVTRREAWANTPALQAGQVHRVPEAFMGRPGPRLVDGFRALKAVVEAARQAR
ncbi:MAG: cobalamin-binding protein [Deltaproteobacteria bacterium]|nr:MAG: cobalamin-binding protein [Deltaproteobacteria bacterium]